MTYISKAQVLLMAFCTGLIVANIYYCQPLIVLISSEFHVSESNAGQLTFLTQVGYALGLLFCVPLGDKFERKSQILAMTGVAVFMLVLAAMAPNLAILKLSGLLVGFTCVVPQLILPMAAHLTPPERRGKVIGTIMSGLLVGILLSRTLSGIIGAHLGWRGMFWIAAGLTLALLILMVFAFPQNRPNFKGSYASLMRSLLTLIKAEPVLREASAINACGFATFGLFWTTMVFLFSKAPYNYGSDLIGLFGLAAAAGALGAPLVGRLSDKQSPRIAVGYGIGLLLLGFIIYYFFRTNLIWMIIGIIVMDLGMQGIHVSNQTRVYALNPSARNRLNTVFMTSSFIGTSAGSGIGLLVWNWKEWTGVCLTGIILMLIALGIYLSTYKREKQA